MKQWYKRAFSETENIYGTNLWDIGKRYILYEHFKLEVINIIQMKAWGSFGVAPQNVHAFFVTFPVQ